MHIAIHFSQDAQFLALIEFESVKEQKHAEINEQNDRMHHLQTTTKQPSDITMAI